MVTASKPGPSLYFNEYTIIGGTSEGTQHVQAGDAAAVTADVVTDGKETISVILYNVLTFAARLLSLKYMQNKPM